jgi:hypothetical protein
MLYTKNAVSEQLARLGRLLAIGPLAGIDNRNCAHKQFCSGRYSIVFTNRLRNLRLRGEHRSGWTNLTLSPTA